MYWNQQTADYYAGHCKYVFQSEHSFLGKLGGIVKPNDGSCHLDSKGVYTHSNDLDYPSVSQINHKVKENSVNIIFAVTEEQFNVYDLLQQNVEGSSVGTLSNDSSNIVELVKAQYQVQLWDPKNDFIFNFNFDNKMKNLWIVWISRKINK